MAFSADTRKRLGTLIRGLGFKHSHLAPVLGIGTQQISRVLNGRVPAQMDAWRRLLAQLEIPPEFLLDGGPDPSQYFDARHLDLADRLRVKSAARNAQGSGGSSEAAESLYRAYQKVTKYAMEKADPSMSAADVADMLRQLHKAHGGDDTPEG